ncbi:MAG TPA: DUF4340 domain-containing protein [bacterium]|nr:DUF4340 domain-containing protein [bacterium]
MNPRVTMILAVVVAAIAAYIFAVDRPQAQRAEQAKHLIQFQKSEITGVSLMTSKGTVALARRDATHWDITQPYSTPAASFSVSDLLDAVTGIVPQRTLGAVGQDAAAYGLNAPDVKMTLRATGGKTVTVELGKASPVGTAIYARLDPGAVYLLDAAVKDSLSKSAADLRQKTLADFANADVQQVRIASADSTLVVDRTGPDRWRIEGAGAPHAHPAWPADDFKVTDMFFPLTTSEAKRFHDGVTDLRPYGLDHPAVTMDLALKGHPEPLRILVAPGGKVAYGMIAGAHTVLELDPTIVGKVAPAAITLLSTRVLPYNPADLTTFTWRRNGQSLEVHRQGPGFTGGRLSDQDVSDMFSAMNLLDADSVRAVAASPQAAPAFEIRTDGGTDARFAVRFYPQPKGGWLVTDQALGLEYVVAANALDALPTSIKTFLGLPAQPGAPSSGGHGPAVTHPGATPPPAGTPHKP